MYKKVHQSMKVSVDNQGAIALSKNPVNSKAFLIPWTGGAFAPLGPFLCPTTEEKKWPIAPNSGP
jgi:hypothetical protein